MGIHSDSIYKDTQREVEAKKVDTEQVVGKDAEGNVFAKVEDTANGGRLVLLDDEGNETGGIYVTETAKGDEIQFFLGSDKSIIRGIPGGRCAFSSPDAGIVQINDAVKLGGSIDVNADMIKNIDETAGTSDPTTDAPDGWIAYETQAGNVRHIPFYT